MMNQMLVKIVNYQIPLHEELASVAAEKLHFKTCNYFSCMQPRRLLFKNEGNISHHNVLALKTTMVCNWKQRSMISLVTTELIWVSKHSWCAFLLSLGLSGQRGIVVACVCPSVSLSVRKLYLVRTKTRHRFDLESPNLHQTWTTWDNLGCYWKWRSSTLTFRVILAIWTHNFRIFGLSTQ